MSNLTYILHGNVLFLIIDNLAVSLACVGSIQWIQKLSRELSW